jgi:hypothetical protein
MDVPPPAPPPGALGPVAALPAGSGTPLTALNDSAPRKPAWRRNDDEADDGSMPFS